MIYEVYHKNDKTHRDRERERDKIYTTIYIYIILCFLFEYILIVYRANNIFDLVYLYT